MLALWCPIEEPAEKEELVGRLRKWPIAYRHVLGLIDPESCDNVRPPDEWRLHRIGRLPFLVCGQPEEESGYVMVWDEPNDEGASRIAGFLDEHVTSQLVVLGEPAFKALRPKLPDGVWRRSRNYELIPGGFKPRPSDLVRRLTHEDRAHVEKAIRIHEAAAHRSTMRDFDAMAEGRPARCWGAFVDGDLAGFVSTNPICAGVTEMSWIFTAEPFRRRGIAAGLLSAACDEALSRGHLVGYHAGSAGDDLDHMVRQIGFTETLATYRFIPSSSPCQWLAGWGRPI